MNVRLSIPLTILVAMVSTVALGQQGRSKNNPYSPSPSGYSHAARPAGGSEQPVQPNANQAAFIARASVSTADGTSRLAPQTPQIAPSADPQPISPTDTYKIGIGDVLYIELKNAARVTGYHTVRQDGTIDFPLAGDQVIVDGQTADDIERMLCSRIVLYSEPQVEVKVREYGSHKITVSGLVENSGETSLQREAMPLYVIRSVSIVSPKASKAIITRGGLQNVEEYDLHDPDTDDVLVYPGNRIEFTGGDRVYFISGSIASPGQKPLVDGMTLYQAIAAAGGARGNIRRAVIRRKNEVGALVPLSFDLHAIRNGKAVDPRLNSGDVLEIKN